mmetsp:Transcript_7054/g.18012  ORF Transcript_7054/g.18012 Transcript_7054/m.18012 type:complete len:120 (+) Transcript_7054:115-474(+)
MAPCACAAKMRAGNLHASVGKAVMPRTMMMAPATHKANRRAAGVRAEAQRKGDAKVLAGAAAMATTLAAAAPALATVNEVGQVAGAEFLPSVLVPLIGLVFPAITMASIFLYVEKEQIS